MIHSNSEYDAVIVSADREYRIERKRTINPRKETLAEKVKVYCMKMKNDKHNLLVSKKRNEVGVMPEMRK